MKCKIQKIDRTESEGRIIAVSDIHGHAHYLEGVLKKANYSVKDTLVIVGDLIDKGPYSLKTVRYVMKLKEENPNVYATMGNVDWLRLHRFFTDDASGFLEMIQWTKNVWTKGFFLDILKELVVDVEELTEENIEEVRTQINEKFAKELAFLWNLPTVLVIGDYLFVHAGVPTDDLEMLKDIDAAKCMKIDAFLNSEVTFEKHVVVGHWPVCLYGKSANCVKPIFDSYKNIISIDGGCGLRHGAQLNALLIPNPNAKMQEVSFVSYDDYPMVVAQTAQAPREKTLMIQYFDSEVKVLKREGNELYVEHISTGGRIVVPEHFIYYIDNKAYCYDCSDEYLAIEEGDMFAVIAETSVGRMVKKDGLIGWYGIKKKERDN